MCYVFTQHHVFIKNLIPLCPPLLYCRFTDSAPPLAEMPHPKTPAFIFLPPPVDCHCARTCW